jgi:hypothetical protein
MIMDAAAIRRYLARAAFAFSRSLQASDEISAIRLSLVERAADFGEHARSILRGTRAQLTMSEQFTIRYPFEGHPVPPRVGLFAYSRDVYGENTHVDERSG